jgi:hypothetical protein
MSERFTTETFFRPEEVDRSQINLSAELFNRCRLLLSRCESEHLFVPIRSMQYQAVIDREEAIFVDNLGGYAIRDGEGGRLIVLAWVFGQRTERDSLSAPVSIERIAYNDQAVEIHRRLMSEFPKALERLEEKVRESGCEPKRKSVLPFRRDD